MSEKLKSKQFKVVLTIITVAALVAITISIRHQISDTVNNLAGAKLGYIALIVPLALTNHFFQGKLYQGMFRVLGNRFRTKPMMRLSLELNFVNNVFPSAGVSGFSYLGFRMHDEKVPAGRSTMVQAMRFMLIFMTFQILLGLGLLMLAINGGVNNLVMLAAGSISTLLIIGTALGLFIIGSKKRIKAFFATLTRGLNFVFKYIRPSRNPETITISKVERVFSDLHDNYRVIRKDLSKLKRPLLFAFLANLVEIVSIYMVFLAFGYLVNPGAVIMAYAVANFAGILSVLPGGIGVYEGLMTGVLTAAGIPISLSLPVVITFRILSMAIQLPIGYILYYYNIHNKRFPL